jgi:hypothetical protein
LKEEAIVQDKRSRLKVLAFEDEPLVAMALENMLADSGSAVVGPAQSLKQGLRHLYRLKLNPR